MANITKPAVDSPVPDGDTIWHADTGSNSENGALIPSHFTFRVNLQNAGHTHSTSFYGVEPAKGLPENLNSMFHSPSGHGCDTNLKAGQGAPHANNTCIDSCRSIPIQILLLEDCELMRDGGAPDAYR